MPEEDSRTWGGGCQCGAIRYEIDPATILTAYRCHCTECQRQSGSAFGMSLKLPPSGFRLLKGGFARWTRRGDSGGINRANFCPDCGVRILHDGGENSGWLTLKPGTLDDPGGVEPVGDIWTNSAQAWVPLPAERLRYQRQPDSYAALGEAWQAQVTATKGRGRPA